MNGSQTITCLECSTAVILPEQQAANLAGQSLACPVCGAPIMVTISKALVKAAPPPAVSGKPVRLTCPKCFAQFTLSHDAACRIAGKSMSCLKCNADIKVPVIEALVASSPAYTPMPPMASDSTSSVKQKETSLAGAATKPCVICFILIDADAVFCPHCGGRQSKISHASGGTEGRTNRLKLHKEPEQSGPPCIQCGKPVNEGLDVCPACNTYQKTGKRGKATIQPPGWQTERKTYSKTQSIMHKLSMAGFTLVLLAVLTFICFKIYKLIISQLPQ